jgi:hypothetical protein
MSVAVAPDESIALVTCASKLDPADAKKVVPDDTLTVIDPKASPRIVIATLKAGLSASGGSFNKQRTVALAANRNEGTVSVFTVSDRVLTCLSKSSPGLQVKPISDSWVDRLAVQRYRQRVADQIEQLPVVKGSTRGKSAFECLRVQLRL